MLIFAKFEQGHSADMILIDNVVSYLPVGKNSYVVTYKDPKHNNELFDIIIKHVIEIKEVTI